MQNAKTVRGHLRGLDVLKALNARDHSTVIEVAKACGLPRPTVYRMLDTLIEAGYVERINHGEHYCLRSQVLELSRGFEMRAHAIEIAKPYVQDLASETGWPTYITAFDEQQCSMIIKHVVRSPKELGRPRLGASIPVLLSSPGRSYLSLLNSTRRSALLDELLTSRSFGRYAPVDARRVEAAIRDSRVLGVGVRDNDMLPGTVSISAPICVHGEPKIFVALVAMRSVMSLNRVLDTYLPSIKRLTETVERHLHGAWRESAAEPDIPDMSTPWTSDTRPTR